MENHFVVGSRGPGSPAIREPGLVQFVENEFATMNDLIAQRLHVRMEPCRRSHTVFVANLVGV